MPDVESQIRALKNDTCKIYSCGCCCSTFCLGALIGFIFLMCSITKLGPEEQVIVYGPEGKYARNGPGTILVTPLRKKEWRRANRLSLREYAVIKNSKTGLHRHEAGPQLLFMDAYEEFEKALPKVILQKHEYMRLIDGLTGNERVVSGPQTLVPRPYEEAPQGSEDAVVLGTDFAVLTINKTNGLRRLITDGGVFIPAPYEVIEEIRTATLLAQREFAMVRNAMNGTLRHEAGPKLLQVGAYEELVKVLQKIVLEKDEYIRLLDEATGKERIERGPQTFVPEATEVYPEGIMKAKFLDTNNAVLVLNETSGQERLVDAAGVFVPKPEEEILESRELIRVLPHEAIVIRDAHGGISVKNGRDSDSAFFLPPYSQVVVHEWSDYSDAGQADGAKINITKIDTRELTMFFKYEVRTSDNVELRLEGQLYWQLIDVPMMINVTSDPSGDVWHHARSALIEAVSQNTLQQFMANFQNISAEASSQQKRDGFYSGRGLALNRMELSEFGTIDSKTKEILQKIIQEATNRVNRLQKQKGENEVKLAELASQIVLAKEKEKLLTVEATNKRVEAKMQGEADGTTLMRVADTFIGGLNDTVDNLTSRVDMFKLHETLEGHNKDISNLASGKAELYVTPTNVKLLMTESDDEEETGRRLQDTSSPVDVSAEAAMEL